MRKGFVCQAIPVLAAALLVAGVASAQEPMPLPARLKPDSLPAVTADFIGGGHEPQRVIQAQCANCGLPPNELLPMNSCDSCGGNCVDLETDIQHCGTCTKICQGGWNCCDGAACRNTGDSRNCGSGGSLRNARLDGASKAIAEKARR